MKPKKIIKRRIPKRQPVKRVTRKLPKRKIVMRPPKKSLFNDKQRRIIQELSKSRVGLTPYSISKRTGISWVTTKKHIKKLQSRRVVTCPRISPHKKTCKLNFDLIYGKPIRRRTR